MDPEYLYENYLCFYCLKSFALKFMMLFDCYWTGNVFSLHKCREGMTANMLWTWWSRSDAKTWTYCLQLLRTRVSTVPWGIPVIYPVSPISSALYLQTPSLFLLYIVLSPLCILCHHLFPCHLILCDILDINHQIYLMSPRDISIALMSTWDEDTVSNPSCFSPKGT